MILCFLKVGSTLYGPSGSGCDEGGEGGNHLIKLPEIIIATPEKIFNIVYFSKS